MGNTGFDITVPHIFSPISAICAESKLYFVKLRLIVSKTLRINALNFLILNKIVLIKFVKNHIILVFP